MQEFHTEAAESNCPSAMLQRDISQLASAPSEYQCFGYYKYSTNYNNDLRCNCVHNTFTKNLSKWCEERCEE